MNALLGWLDHRTGVRSLVHEALYERIPGGSRWRYVWGSTLVFAFFVQLVTGVFLWMAYSPSAQTAWESVFYIQHEMQGGWLLRGLHHFMAQAMVVLLALHLMQVVIDGAYRAPREVNFWIGLILMQIVLGLSLTGYLLPWDQKGLWATQVATNLLGIVPGIGEPLKRLVVGGTTAGHHTLTRFFALHAGVLPGLLILLLVMHVALFRRHGICARQPDRRPEQTFWPDQILKDGVACLAVLAVVLLLTVWPVFRGGHADMRPGEYLGADLGAPADPSTPYAAARPEWYFLFLFQFLKYFPGEAELVGAVIIPAGLMLVLFLMPLLGRWKLGHGFNVGFVTVLLLGIVGLTAQAIRDDQRDPNYHEAVADAEFQAERVKLLSFASGIPEGGAIALLRNDPKVQGPELFAQYCASCHLHQDPATVELIDDGELAAPNLYGFGSRAWLAGFLDPEQIDGPNYFGRTEHAEGEMVDFVQGMFSDLDEEGQESLAKAIAALSAEAALPAQAARDEQDAELIAEGRELLTDEYGCTDCHRLHDEGDLGTAPDLSGWGSREWLAGIIRDPAHEHFYGDNNDRMPAFAPEEGTATLDERQIGLLVDWLRGDWYEATRDDEQPADESDAPGETVAAAESR